MITTRPRRKHAGQIGVAVRDDFQGQGVGSALMHAAVDVYAMARFRPE